MENTHRLIFFENLSEYPVAEIAKDPTGSKLIIRELNDATDRQKEAIFHELRPELFSLMKDALGNYVVQKIFEIGAETQRHKLRRIIQTEFMELSMHKYASRVVQTAIEHSHVLQQIFIITLVFPDDFVELSKNDNGNHVMQQLFRCVPLNVKDYLFDKVKNDILELSLDPYGSHVIQYILANGSPTHRSEIFKCIARNAGQLLKLIQDCYGNYVIQHAVQYCAQTDKDYLMWFIIEGATALAQDKYASNVVERTLKYAAPDMKKQALRIICNQKPDGVRTLCMDAYANFVVQKLVVDSEDVVMLANLYGRIRPNLGETSYRWPQYYRQARTKAPSRTKIWHIQNIYHPLFIFNRCIFLIL